jgi:hypothetical protein
MEKRDEVIASAAGFATDRSPQRMTGAAAAGLFVFERPYSEIESAQGAERL